MFGWFPKKKTEEEDYFEDLERRKRQDGAQDGPFRMKVDDVFAVRGRGVVAVGRIESGRIETGGHVRVRGAAGSCTAVVGGLEQFRRTVQTAKAGDHVGVLLQDLSREDVGQGDLLLSADGTGTE